MRKAVFKALIGLTLVAVGFAMAATIWVALTKSIAVLFACTGLCIAVSFSIVIIVERLEKRGRL